MPQCRECKAELEASGEQYLSCPKGHGGLIRDDSAADLWKFQLQMADCRVVCSVIR